MDWTGFEWSGCGVVCVALMGCGSGAAGGDTDTEGAESSGAATDAAASGPAGDPSAGSAETNAGSDSDDPSAGSSPETDGADSQDGETEGPALPAGAGCCEPHADAGCDEVGPELCVCTELPECCVFDWTSTCSDLATSRCQASCRPDDDPTTGVDSDSDSDSDTDSAGARCELTQIELDSDDAILTGAWQVTMSQQGEGVIMAIFGQQTQGTINFAVDIPCDDQWFVWVRYFEEGNADSYYVTLDGEPNPAGVYEADCSPAGGGYDWGLLNYRTENDPLCQSVEDPWAPQWDEGQHDIRFAFRESRALSRLIVTNDPAFVP